MDKSNWSNLEAIMGSLLPEDVAWLRKQHNDYHMAGDHEGQRRIERILSACGAKLHG